MGENRNNTELKTLEIQDVRKVQKFQLLVPVIHKKVKKSVLLPLLHCLYFDKTGPDGSQGIGVCCLEIGLFGWGESLAEAGDAIKFIITAYFKERIENDRLNEIEADFTADAMELYWSLYRRISLHLHPYLFQTESMS